MMMMMVVVVQLPLRLFIDVLSGQLFSHSYTYTVGQEVLLLLFLLSLGLSIKLWLLQVGHQRFSRDGSILVIFIWGIDGRRRFLLDKPVSFGFISLQSDGENIKRGSNKRHFPNCPHCPSDVG